MLIKVLSIKGNMKAAFVISVIISVAVIELASASVNDSAPSAVTLDREDLMVNSFIHNLTKASTSTSNETNKREGRFLLSLLTAKLGLIKKLLGEAPAPAPAPAARTAEPAPAPCFPPPYGNCPYYYPPPPSPPVAAPAPTPAKAAPKKDTKKNKVDKKKKQVKSKDE